MPYFAIFCPATSLAKVLSEHLAKQHQIKVEHGEEKEEKEAKSTNPLPRKSGRPRGMCVKGKKMKKS